MADDETQDDEELEPDEAEETLEPALRDPAYGFWVVFVGLLAVGRGGHA